MAKPTPEMIADPNLGACLAMREGCDELGAWWPFYQAHICRSCLAADQSDVLAGHLPEWWARLRARLRSLLWLGTFTTWGSGEGG